MTKYKPWILFNNPFCTAITGHNYYFYKKMLCYLTAVIQKLLTPSLLA